MNLDKLTAEAIWFRKEIFNLVIRAKKGHIPSCFSIAEFLVYIFFNQKINLNSKNITDPNRDRMIISKGHAAMALYPIFCRLGLIPEKELLNFCGKDALLKLYADPSIPGIDTVTGSLGNGYGIATGIALDLKRKNSSSKVFSIVGDGECYEGSIWESAMFIGHHKLTNLITIIDRNKLCIMGETEDCISLEPLDKKWEAFGFTVFRIDGHDFSQIDYVFKSMNDEKPVCIILDTIKGKGISYMENKPLWHNRIPDGELLKIAKNELGINE
jgi:transketolase